MPENIPSAPGGENPLPAAPTPAPEAAQAPVAPVTPPVAPAPAPEAKPTVEEAIASADFSKLSDDDLKVLDSGDAKAIARVLGVVDEPAPETPPEGTPPAGTPPPVEKPKAPDRISLRAIEDPAERIAVAEAMSLIRDPKSGFTTLKAALAHTLKIGAAAAHAPGDAPLDPLDPGAAPAAPPEPVVAPAVKAIQDQIAALEAQHTELNEVKFDYGAAAKVMREIGKLEAALVRAELKAESEMTADEAWDRGQTESRARALAEHADLIEAEGSEFMTQVDYEIWLADRGGDAILSRPDWPEKISQRVFEKHYKGSANGKTASPPTADVTQPIPPAPPRARLPGSPIGPAATSGAVTAQVAMTEIDSLSWEDRAAVLEALDAKK